MSTIEIEDDDAEYYHAIKSEEVSLVSSIPPVLPASQPATAVMMNKETHQHSLTDNENENEEEEPVPDDDEEEEEEVANIIKQHTTSTKPATVTATPTTGGQGVAAAAGYGGGEVYYKLPVFLLNEFYRLASALQMDQSDIQLLFNPEDENEHEEKSAPVGNPESDYSYFMNEVIRKIERIQHEGGGKKKKSHNNDEEEDEEMNEEKHKKLQLIKKQEKALSKKSLKLQENINSELQKIIHSQQEQEKGSSGGHGHGGDELEMIQKQESKKMNQFNRLLTKYYREKKQNKIYEEFISTQNKKIDLLVEHIEKLMKSLKIESNKKLKILEELNVKRKEESGLQEKIAKQQRMQGAHEK